MLGQQNLKPVAAKLEVAEPTNFTANELNSGYKL